MRAAKPLSSEGARQSQRRRRVLSWCRGWGGHISAPPNLTPSSVYCGTIVCLFRKVYLIDFEDSLVYASTPTIDFAKSKEGVTLHGRQFTERRQQQVSQPTKVAVATWLPPCLPIFLSHKRKDYMLQNANTH